MPRTSIWDLYKTHVFNSTEQPCTLTFKIQPKYSDNGVLTDNWFESRHGLSKDPITHRKVDTTYNTDYEGYQQTLPQIIRTPKSNYSMSYRDPCVLKKEAQRALFRNCNKVSENARLSAVAPGIPDPLEPGSSYLLKSDSTETHGHSLVSGIKCAVALAKPPKQFPKIEFIPNKSPDVLPAINQRIQFIEESPKCIYECDEPDDEKDQPDDAQKCETVHIFNDAPVDGINFLQHGALESQRSQLSQPESIQLNCYKDDKRCVCDLYMAHKSDSKYGIPHYNSTVSTVMKSQTHYPYSISNKINWKIPNLKPSCHTSCQ